MPKYWQCLLFLFFSVWIPVITMKKSVANFPLQAYFPWDSLSRFQCDIVVPAAYASWKLSGTGFFSCFFFFIFLPLRLICFTNSEHWFLLAPPSYSLVCAQGITGVSFPAQATLRHRYMQFLCIIRAMFHIGRSKHIECCNNWSNT